MLNQNSLIIFVSIVLEIFDQNFEINFRKWIFDQNCRLLTNKKIFDPNFRIKLLQEI